jgi:hypothetical protein
MSCCQDKRLPCGSVGFCPATSGNRPRSAGSKARRGCQECGRANVRFHCSERISAGRIEINEAEAAIVVRIFEWYAEGMLTRSIAARLNAENVSSPGASWRRRDAEPSGILSDEAVARAQKAMQDEPRSSAAPRKNAPPSPPASKQAKLDVQERERGECTASAARRDPKADADGVRLVPETAALYREAVRNLNATLTKSAERLAERNDAVRICFEIRCADDGTAC